MNHKEMHDNSAIECYNHLEKTHKQLFLLCGVIGGVASIEEVLQYSWGLDLFGKELATIQEARDRLHALILDLKESCLLLDDVDSRNSIKMHDVVRDVAISIGKKDFNMLSWGEHDAELKNIWHKNDVLERCTAMVLHGCPKLTGLPSHLECPSLELFVMSGFSRGSSPSIPETFFEKTSKLKVLEMSRLCFTALPLSLSFLKNLQTLRLNDCDSLKDISVIGGLNKLQTLSFAASGIEELPSGIGQLSELRSLDVRRCSELKVIPAGLIEGLTRLEELYVGRSFNRWEAEECVNGSVKINASLRELKHLHNLCSLEIKVEDDKLLPEDIHFEKLERYEIIVGDFDYMWLLYDIEVTRKICLQLSTTSTSINLLQHGVKMLFESTECLWLEELKGFKNVTPALDVDGFPNLKHLLIQKDYNIQHIVNVEDKQRNAVFPCLESLHLIHLLKLQKICNGPLMKGSFCNLTTMKVNKCNGLESLFSFSMATGLPRLQEIDVYDCDALEVIVAKENIKDEGVNINDGVCEKIEFAQLRRLYLNRLPRLKNFFSNGEIQNKSRKSLSPEIQTKDEEEEFKSSLPFFTKVSFPKLQELHLSRIPSLKYLLTPSVATGLVGLESLKVEDCEGMKHLVVAEEEGETNIETITFPQLSSLCLEELPNLTAIYSEMGSYENLDTATQPLLSEKVSFPKLEELELAEISNLTEIWSHKFQEISCCNLTSLSICKCKSLKHVFPASMAPSLNKLEYLRVEYCEAVETIIGDENCEEGIIKATQHERTFMFAKLIEVCLQNLSNLEWLYPREHTIECPALTSIDVADCGKLNGLDFLSFPEKQGDDLFEKVMSKLENLSIRNSDLMKILELYDHFPTHLFSSLNTLVIVEFHGGSVVFPSVSFKSLQTLIMKNCGGLTNLIQTSTATSLEQLRKVIISGCEMMENVIGDDDDEESSRDDNEIIFPNLEYLKLEKLPRLTNFCSSPSYTFNFPQLWRVDVNECPNMKTFCGGITTTPKLNKVYCEGEGRWEGDLNTTVQKVFEEMNATNPERETKVSEISPESRKGTETCEEVVEEGKEAGICVKATAHEKGKGKGKEVEVSDITRHSDPSHNFTAQQPTVASNSKLSSHSEEFERLIPSTSSNSQEAEIHGMAAEPTKEHQICKHVVDDISDQGTFTENAIEPRIATEISEELVDICAQHVVPSSPRLSSPISSSNNNFEVEAQLHYKSSKKVSDDPITAAEKSAKMEVHKLPHLLQSTSSTNYIEAAAQVPENSAKAQNDATNAEKTADTFEEGKGKEHYKTSKETPCHLDPSSHNYTAKEQTIVGSLASGQTNPPAETSLSLSTELEVRISTPTVESEATNPRKAGETSNHSEMESLARTSSSIHFIPLLSEFLQIIQNQPLKSMSAEHVQFMENAFRDLSAMNFSIEWFIPYVQKARECLPVLESRREISELELEIAKMEAELEAVREKKKALEEKYEGVASRIDLDKPLHDS